MRKDGGKVVGGNSTDVDACSMTGARSSKNGPAGPISRRFLALILACIVLVGNASPVTERVGVCMPIAEDDISISAQAVQASFRISATDPACAGVLDGVWTPINSASWLTFRGATQVGNSIVVAYSVSRNHAQARTGTIT